MNRILKILIIDDDEVDRIIVKRALKATEFEYDITENFDANDALENLKKNNYDCVFLDYLLPGTDGLSLLKKARAEGVRSPIVIVTSQGDEKIAVEMMKAGASDYVIKTQINAHAIAQILRNVIRLQDIENQRYETEQALKVSESRLAEAQRLARIGNWEFHLSDRSVYWSEEVFRIFDRDVESFVPNKVNFLSCIHPDDHPIVIGALKKAIKNELINVDFRIITPEDELKYANSQGYSIFNTDNKLVKIVGTVQDISERKRVEQELIEAKRVAEDSMKVKQQFLANMSHEIRTPMNAIIGFTRILLKDDLPDEMKRYLEAIHFSSENLLVIINDILDFSKIESGKLTLEEVEFCLQEVIHPIIELFQPKVKEKNIELIYKIENNVPDYFLGDPFRLNQVIINLISNGLKFTESGSITLMIKVLEQDNNFASLEFSVEDTGIGIPNNKLESIFDSFTQASSDTTRKYGGTGLGLAIVKNILELQDGKIWVESVLGKGSKFTFTLPLKKNHTGNAQKPGSFLSSEKDKSTNLEKVKVLLVEDNEINQLLAETVLRSAGCEVTIADNGKIALEKLQANAVDIVLMDIQMPEMDGYEATSYIRSNFKKPLSQVPIIAMTAHAMSPESAKCIQAGMNDYISKPFEANDLYHKIASLVKKNKSSKENNNIQDSIQNNPYMSERVVNLDYLKQMAEGNEAFVTKAINLFLQKAPVDVENLLDNFKKKDWGNLKLLCHKVKSSFAILGIKSLQEIMQSIENDCSENKIDEAKFEKLLSQTQSYTSKAIEELTEELQKAT
ncbi:MAG TPA: response regulator [Cytophagales bacterium]|nr:response regulator [Cytophagales bacterium]